MNSVSIRWTEFVHKELPSLGVIGRKLKAAFLFGGVNLPQTVYVFLAVLMICQSSGVGNDDGVISLVYGRNLGHGYGAVYNLGERVEGFTNPLIVFVTAGLVATGIPDPIIPYAIMVLCILAGVTTLVAIYQYGKTAIGAGPSWLVVMLVSICPSLAFWAGSILETSIFVLAVVLVYILVSRIDRGNDYSRANRRLIGYFVLISFLTLLVRSDGFLVLFLVPLFFFLKGKWRWGSLSLVTVSLLTAVEFAVRYAYYGKLLPNTAIAKVDGPISERIINAIGILYQHGFSTAILIPIAVLLIATISSLLIVVKNRSFKELPFEAVFFPAWMGYYLWVGGDVYQERPLTPFYPIGIYILVKMFLGLKGFTQKSVAVIVVAISLLSPITTRYNYLFSSTKGGDAWMALGNYLDDHFPGHSIALDAAGKIAWGFKSSSQKTDMLGLCDAHIASLQPMEFRLGHSKYDNHYVLDVRKPDLIATWISPGLDLPMTHISKDEYEQRGYRLCLLVNGQGQIVDISGFSLGKIQPYISNSFNYGVLKRHSDLDKSSMVRPEEDPKEVERRFQAVLKHRSRMLVKYQNW